LLKGLGRTAVFAAAFWWRGSDAGREVIR
jgi:hypothetical protein